jgi:hypothetical protein
MISMRMMDLNGFVDGGGGLDPREQRAAALVSTPDSRAGVQSCDVPSITFTPGGQAQ